MAVYARTCERTRTGPRGRGGNIGDWRLEDVARPAIMMLPELFINAKATLGEGPVWDAKSQTLYWIDVLEKRIYAGPKLFLQLEDFVGCLAPRKDGGLVIAQRFGFWAFDPDTNKLLTLASPKGEPSNNRFNDGKCDPRGRFVA